MFDSQSKQWREDLAGDLASLSGPPLPVAPGEAIYIHTAAAAAQLEGPDPTLRVRYYHQDHLGSSSAITDSQGGINEQTAFYPGGNPRSQTKNPRLDEPYQFTQKEREQESRLQYFETRYLMDSLSRFASVDSEFLAPDMLSTNRLAAFFAQPQQMNPYAYVMNNPLRWVDPNGRAPGDPFKTANAAATDALLVANPQSITANREYGGLIYYDPTVKRYYATTPTTGTGSSFNPGAVAIPAGTRKVGDYHTHGDYTFMLQLPTLTTDGTGKPVISVNNVPFRGPKATDFYDSEHFSGTDKTGIASDATGVPGYKGYLGTPAGTFQQYDPANGQVSGLSSTKPAKDPVSCRAIYTGEFPGPIKVTCE